MENFLISHERDLRLGVFFGVFAIMALWETARAKRPQNLGRARRWPNNLALTAFNAVLIRFIPPIFPLGVALKASSHEWGLFNLVGLPGVVEIVLAFVLLDLAIYTQHMVFHKVPALWRLHRMHHADTEIDVTTGARFHPIEIALSLVVKMVLIALLGAPATAVILFEIVLNGAAMFNHANVGLPERLDRCMRWFIVTPDMHRVHHSIDVGETDSNFGFNLPWWDRLFGTYAPAPKLGHLGMTTGLPDFRAPEESRLDRLLTQPFRNDPSVP